MKSDISEQLDKKLDELLERRPETPEITTEIVEEDDTDNTQDTLVFSGGGAKGIAFIGVLKALEQLNKIQDITTYACVSVGSLMSALYVIGYTADDMLKFVHSFDLDKLKNINLFSLLQEYGVDNGSRMTYVVKRLIKNKGFDENITLSNVHEKIGKRMVIVITSVNKNEPVYLTPETHPDMPLHMAVRSSISIPIFYTPMNLDSQLYIDGGCTDNYPIHLFSDRLPKVIGVMLGDQSDYISQFTCFEDYAKRVYECLVTWAQKLLIKGYEEHTIMVELQNVGLIDYGSDPDKIKRMVECGYSSTINYFKNQPCFDPPIVSDTLP